MSMARDLPSLQAVVRRAARALCGSDGATFVLRDGDRCFYADEDAIGPLWKGQRFPLEQCISGWAMLHGQPVVIPDIYADDRIPHDAYRSTFVKSLVMVPIRTAAPIGAIGNYWADPHTVTAEEVRLIQALANSTAVAMENIALYDQIETRVVQRTAELELAQAELRRQAQTDDLPGLYNRRGFLALAGERLRSAPAGRGREAVLVFLDVDGLKAVNDNHGHDQGDACLRRVAEVLRATYARSDLVARLAGGEFAVLALGADAAELTERLERAFAGAGGCADGVSVGAVSASASGTTLEELLCRADQAMYMEKQRSRPRPFGDPFQTPPNTSG